MEGLKDPRRLNLHFEWPQGLTEAKPPFQGPTEAKPPFLTRGMVSGKSDMIRRSRALSITIELFLLESPSPASLWERGIMDVWKPIPWTGM